MTVYGCSVTGPAVREPLTSTGKVPNIPRYNNMSFLSVSVGIEQYKEKP
jgi:hypothetical protein